MAERPLRVLVKRAGNYRRFFLVALMSLLMLQLAGCTPNGTPAAPKTASDPIVSEPATDYSTAAHWLTLPATADKQVDVFYLYPTAWQKVATADPNICNIDNEAMLKGSKAAYGRQATAFETVGNMYAPYYRQADGLYALGLTPDERAKVMGGIPALDAVAAFDYYLNHYNQGRPFILAGHSQGSNVLLFLLAGYLKDHPQAYDRMIAAYLIGYPVTEAYLAKNPHLKFATGPEDLGVIISYNTESPDVVPGTNPVMEPGAIAINPISWTRDETLAVASSSLGSRLPASGSLVPTKSQYADARVDKAKGLVICSTADVGWLHVLSPAFVTGVFHSFDYSLYYYDLRDNAAKRVAKYSGLQSP